MQSKDKEIAVIWNPKKWVKIVSASEESSLKRQNIMTTKTIWTAQKNVEEYNQVMAISPNNKYIVIKTRYGRKHHKHLKYKQRNHET